MTNLTITIIVVRLLISLLIGISVGIIREIQHKAVGLRTTTLICLGSTIFAISSLEFEGAGIMADPSRIAAGIVTGIGFLGAGTIIQNRGNVQGLTSAATIWVMASLGLSIGLGAYWLAIVGAILTVVVLNPFQRIEHAVKGKKSTQTYTLILAEPGPALYKIMSELEKSPTGIQNVKLKKIDDKHEISFDLTHADDMHPCFLADLTKTEGVEEVSATKRA